MPEHVRRHGLRMVAGEHVVDAGMTTSSTAHHLPEPPAHPEGADGIGVAPEEERRLGYRGESRLEVGSLGEDPRRRFRISCAYSGRQSSGANGVMSIPAEVAVSTGRRTHAGRARRAIRATTPPIDCATRSTGPGPARSRTRRARSARLATSGREGTRSRATSCWRLGHRERLRAFLADMDVDARGGRGSPGNAASGGLPGDPDLAENRDQTLDAQGLRGHKPGRAYTLLDGGSNELRRVVAHSFTFEIRAIATAA